MRVPDVVARDRKSFAKVFAARARVLPTGAAKQTGECARLYRRVELLTPRASPSPGMARRSRNEHFFSAVVIGNVDFACKVVVWAAGGAPSARAIVERRAGRMDDAIERRPQQVNAL